MSGIFLDLSWAETADYHGICMKKVLNMANFKMTTIKLPKLPQIHKWLYLGYAST